MLISYKINLINLISYKLVIDIINRTLLIFPPRTICYLIVGSDYCLLRPRRRLRQGEPQFQLSASVLERTL